MGRRYERPIIDTKLRKVLDDVLSDGDFNKGPYRFYCQIARAAGITNSRLSEYSLGRKQIPIHHLLRLCEALHCAPADILGEAHGTESGGLRQTG